jgi:hypothetical protein
VGFWDYLTVCVLHPPSINGWLLYRSGITDTTTLLLKAQNHACFHCTLIWRFLAMHQTIWWNQAIPVYAKKEYTGMHVQLQSFLTLALNLVELPASYPGCFTYWIPVVQLMSQSGVGYRYDANRCQMLSYIAILVRFTFLMQESLAPAQSWNFQHLALVQSMNIHYEYQKLLACVHLFYYIIYFC